jgi:hypothetical protein
VLDPVALGALVDRYGLPIAVLAAFAFATWRGWIVVQSGAQRKAEVQAWQHAAAFQERLRLEEQGRTAVEHRAREKAEDHLSKVVDTVAPALSELRMLLAALEKEVIRSGRSRNGP